jgi:hypothetical protein
MNCARATLAIFTLMATSSYADDSVRIRYDPGYPLAGVSMESTEVTVIRPGGKGSFRETEIDKYFLAIKAALPAADGKPFCPTVALHSPTVTISISLEGQYSEFKCSYGSKGVLLEIDPSARSVRHKEIFEMILKLTLERSRTKFFN